MGKIYQPNPVKLIAGLIFKNKSALKRTGFFLENKFGKIDFESRTLDFNYTNYYEKEFGRGLSRKFISFKKLILPEDLPRIKIFTNKIEQKLCSGGNRAVNIDPGYLDLAKLVLASTKDYAHRVYLNAGIYAEMTLFFRKKSFQAWDWTYPDYRTKEYIEIFNQIRQIFIKQIKNDVSILFRILQ